jgi:extracellular factor (EF) 3-hydroxypalmitic acid methyl ester biosynthesis protein
MPRAKADTTSERGTTSLKKEVYEEISEPLFPRLYELFDAFEQAAKDIHSEDVILHKRYAQHDLHPLLMTAPFVHRTFSKPLGYAGDYEMVNMMLRDSREGPTTYAQLINSLHLQTGVAAAHRNRIEILKEYLQHLAIEIQDDGRIADVLNIGCGPAQELQDLIPLEPLLEDCRFNLLDFNAETLSYTGTQLQRLAREHRRNLHIRLTHESVHQLLKVALRKPKEPSAQKYDLIFCAGLFDYLSDKVCSRLLNLFFNWLKPKGVILATNVHPSNPNRYAMEHLLEWHLVYRNEREMHELAPRMGQQRIFRDSTGVNVFLEVKKLGTEHDRN